MLQSFLKKHAVYNPQTGILTRLADGNTIWTTEKHGHQLAYIAGVIDRVHRFAWVYMTGSYPQQHIDHINRNPADNRWINLRDVDRSTNLKNQHRSQQKGCGVYSYKGKWVVKFRSFKQKRLIHYGTFANYNDAIIAAIAAKEHRDKIDEED